jgi:hypothetical protein
MDLDRPRSCSAARKRSAETAVTWPAKSYDTSKELFDLDAIGTQVYGHFRCRGCP